MGWEKRGHREYYYQKVREGSCVRSVYVGRGEFARAIFHLKSIEREDAEAKRGADQRAVDALRSQDLALEPVAELICLVTEAALIAAGFHTHKRQWRKKRYV